ncbi:MAG: type II toxin-antitoxin system RelE/ParE family toxin [Pseudomonadota bacterium]
MIITLKGRVAEAVAAGKRPKGFPPGLIGRAENKLAMIDAAIRLDDLRSPPGNRLEALKSDRKGAWSIRINDQWRVCFIWDADGAREVEIVDYHD